MQTILITGANRGIGLELTRQYAEDGWVVFACCRSPGNAHELDALATRSDGQIRVYALDVTDDAGRAALSADLRGQSVDILLNNAGVFGDWESQEFGRCRADRWLNILHTNAVAPLLLIQDLVENVAASGRKIIANMSSEVGSISEADAAKSRYIYRSSKAALNMTSKICASDLAARGITVVALHPGWVRTDMGGPDATLSVWESATALRKILTEITFADSGRFINIDGRTIPW
uniref:Short-chain dehydrogenase n=1 Tax=Candidatus Kentrum sp. MB TaxID=2138164 RepID=A0A450XVE9_9GAMM|nr:MAG: Short-chain dehydrogenase [Candidatus Kentron sp. MB]VFK33259.1 MAG: Short-chain dehydrogenase [Candidatus Kentron sp. MB]VFK76118.1 MAG: Short-chain dehydrogenase [Candidatus Kentron sp. MB]